MNNKNTANLLMLNIGCGKRVNPNWVNIDFNPSAQSVLDYDIRKPLPFDDNIFDVVYHSHVLEHLARAKANQLVSECYRVIRPGGIVRIVVPDLEELARNYLSRLEDARSQSENKDLLMSKYQWSVIEMLDQLVRESHGGEMLEFIKTCDESKLKFVRERLGSELDDILQDLCREHLDRRPARSRQGFMVIVKRSMRKCLDRVSAKKTLFMGILGRLGRNREQSISHLRSIKFHDSGELHKWMYDSHSLSRLLQDHCFTRIERVTPLHSRIPNWPEFNLDIDPDGSVYKPNSLIIEAVKPMVGSTRAAR